MPAKIVSIEVNPLGMAMGVVDFGGTTRTVSLDYLRNPVVDEYVIVHMGFAVERIAESELAETYEAIGQIRDLSELELPIAKPAP
jgi:hydrogenase expression/formation protein HypC